MRRTTDNLMRWRPSFTLVELLVAVSIIGVMAGMVLWSMLGAQNDARIARTRGTIQKLNDIILQQWEEYRYKPVDVRIPAGLMVSPRERARVRMLVLRDTMRMEMPDRITDLLYLPSDYTVVHNSGALKIPRAIPPRYGIMVETLRNNMGGLSGFTLGEVPTGNPLAPMSAPRLATGQSDGEWNVAVSSAELLYMIVATSQYAGSSALEFFRPSEIGDTDGDGLLEFLDAWGQPIQWIRWPAGYPGDLIRYADDDAMDPAKTDWRYRVNDNSDWHPRTLVPLILSAGADGDFGVTFDFNDASPPPIAYARMTWPQSLSPPFGTNVGTVQNPHYAAGDYYYVDPFYTNDRLAPGIGNQIGSIPHAQAAEAASDNVTNHDVILEP
jgi:prepilin-type N-terminal cleavage/methylation domain-containing protein